MSVSEEIANRVINRINDKYELERDYLDDFCRMIIEEVDSVKFAEQLPPNHPYAVVPAQPGGVAAKAVKGKKAAEDVESDDEVEVEVTVKKANPYAKFMKETMPKLTDVDPKQRMTEVGKRWKLLTAAQKAAYKM